MDLLILELGIQDLPVVEYFITLQRDIYYELVNVYVTF